MTLALPPPPRQSLSLADSSSQTCQSDLKCFVSTIIRCFIQSLHYRLRRPIGFWKVQNVVQSRHLFLIHKTHKKMQSVWLYILVCKHFEDSLKNTLQKKPKQMLPMWLCILWGRLFGETFENTQWRKVKQMQPVWLCILPGKQFEGTIKSTQWRKIQ